MRRGLPLYGPETWGKRPDSTRFAGSFSLHTIHTKNEAWKYGTANLKNVHRWGASDLFRIPTELICRFPQGIQIHSEFYIIFWKYNQPF